ncbi:hypothetical protein [Nostoc sp.]|uniref:hypothetical protein n=1 Tax=Nostoc sp. TaxID=1180 RepID=UPI002FF51109
MPNAQCPMPNAQCPINAARWFQAWRFRQGITNAQCPILNIFVFLVEVIAKVKGKRENFLLLAS